MTTKVTITFEVSDDQYDDYEECLSDFDSNLQYIGIHEVDIRENASDDTTEITDDGVTINKTTSVEIDSELFFNHISMDVTSWSFDKDDIEDYPEVVEYLEEHEPNELKALREGKIAYLEVYRDTF